jgi:putative peptidoglycan binding protein/CHAP domain-containing protein
MSRELHVTSPMMAGPDVLEVQSELGKLGYAPGVLDASYGPATAGAVRAFQHDYGLAVDGVVGPATLSALATATAAQTHRTPSPTGLLALAEAIKHIGVTESPPDSNRTMFGVWFGVDGVPWCNIFVSYCFQIAAGYTIAGGFAGAGVYPKGCAYVPTTEAWLRLTGMWLGRVTPLPGDIAIYNWDGGDPDHIGIVESYLGDGRFTAIEGNTSVTNKSNGGEVQRATRTLAQVDGFGRVA